MHNIIAVISHATKSFNKQKVLDNANCKIKLEK